MTLRLRQERVRRGWSMDYVARMVGTTNEAVRLYETGQRKPSYNSLCKLEDLYGMGHRELFAEVPDAPKPPDR